MLGRSYDVIWRWTAVFDSDYKKSAHSRANRSVVIKQGGKLQCSRELGDRFIENKKEAQVE